MKTTIDLPEALYLRAKIRAVESGQTLKELVIASLTRDLDASPPSASSPTFFERRRILPEFARLQDAGAFKPTQGSQDITLLISEDRDGR